MRCSSTEPFNSRNGSKAAISNILNERALGGRDELHGTYREQRVSAANSHVVRRCATFRKALNKSRALSFTGLQRRLRFQWRMSSDGNPDLMPPRKTTCRRQFSAALEALLFILPYPPARQLPDLIDAKILPWHRGPFSDSSPRPGAFSARKCGSVGSQPGCT